MQSQNDVLLTPVNAVGQLVSRTRGTGARTRINARHSVERGESKSEILRSAQEREEFHANDSSIVEDILRPVTMEPLQWHSRHCINDELARCLTIHLHRIAGILTRKGPITIRRPLAPVPTRSSFPFLFQRRCVERRSRHPGG